MTDLGGGPGRRPNRPSRPTYSSGLCSPDVAFKPEAIGDPNIIDIQCLDPLLDTPQYFRDQECVWPTITGAPNVFFDASIYPYRVALDFKTTNRTPQNLRGALNTDCNGQLNTHFPGCSTTNGCEWTYQTLGHYDLSGKWIDCGVERSGDGSIINSCDMNAPRCCYFDASYCFRVRFDETYKNSCMNKSLETDFGLSESVWIREDFFAHPNTKLAIVGAGSITVQSITSVSFNPYQIYCDPSWCATNPAADDFHFLECQNSTTIVDGAVRHAALADTGICREWYLASTQKFFDYKFGLHDWGLIDTMIENYCKTTPYAVDSYSCNCVGGQPDRGSSLTNMSNYFTSCSAIGIGAGDCDSGLAPVRAALSQTNVQLLSNPLCANITCINAIELQDTFATRNIHQNYETCPTNTCYLTVLGTTFSANNINNSSVYIGSVEQFCTARSISATAPKFTVQNFPTVWFWSAARSTVTNAATVGLINLENVSPDGTVMNYSVSHDSLPNWLTYRGSPLQGTIAPGNILEFTLVENATSAPLSGSFGFTFSALNGNGGVFSSEVVQLEVAVIATDKAQPVPPPAGSDTNPSDVQLIVSNRLSPGALALIALSILFVILSIALYMQGTFIQNEAFKNLPS